MGSLPFSKWDLHDTEIFATTCIRLNKGLFTWREGAPANRATRLGGLKHSPPLHASHLGEIVSRAAANHNKQDGGQQKRFGGKLLFFYHSFR